MNKLLKKLKFNIKLNLTNYLSSASEKSEEIQSCDCFELSKCQKCGNHAAYRDHAYILRSVLKIQLASNKTCTYNAKIN